MRTRDLPIPFDASILPPLLRHLLFWLATETVRPLLTNLLSGFYDVYVKKRCRFRLVKRHAISFYLHARNSSF